MRVETVRVATQDVKPPLVSKKITDPEHVQIEPRIWLGYPSVRDVLKSVSQADMGTEIKVERGMRSKLQRKPKILGRKLCTGEGRRAGTDFE